MTKHLTPRMYHRALRGALLLGALTWPYSQAAAVSDNVRKACVSDYFAFCSMHAVGSAPLRQCMKANGPNLSNGCVKALAAAGYVSKARADRRTAKLR